MHFLTSKVVNLLDHLHLDAICGVSRKVFQISQQAAISLFLSLGLWKYATLAIRFSANNPLLSHNNENFRGGIIKAFLIVSYSVESMPVCLTS